MKRSTRRKSRGGFTLMEMLVVLAILVLLMALVAPRILGTQEKADINATKTQLGMFKGALDHYHLDMRAFPPTAQGLQALFRPTSTGEDSSTGSWAGPYVNAAELPADPWGNPFGYEYPPTRGMGEYPDIWSYGPDGLDSTEDDITSWNSASQGEGGLDEFGGDEFEDFGNEFSDPGFEDFSDPMSYDDLGLE